MLFFLGYSSLSEVYTFISIVRFSVLFLQILARVRLLYQLFLGGFVSSFLRPVASRARVLLYWSRLIPPALSVHPGWFSIMIMFCKFVWLLPGPVFTHLQGSKCSNLGGWQFQRNVLQGGFVSGVSSCSVLGGWPCCCVAHPTGSVLWDIPVMYMKSSLPCDVWLSNDGLLFNCFLEHIICWRFCPLACHVFPLNGELA